MTKTLFDRILHARGLQGVQLEGFIHPDYQQGHDPYLLPDMQLAIDRLVEARGKDEFITIYGDYDIDGLTATAVLVEAFRSFGFKRVETFIPNRFKEGYGMTEDAVERIAETGSTLIITVDCGSLSHGPITRAAELGVDVIVTDHHNVAPTQPPAVAVINPKRLLQDFPEMYDGFKLKPTALSSLPLPSSPIAPSLLATSTASHSLPLPSSPILTESAHRSLDAGPASKSAPSFEKSEISSKAGAAPLTVTRLEESVELASSLLDSETSAQTRESDSTGSRRVEDCLTEGSPAGTLDSVESGSRRAEAVEVASREGATPPLYPFLDLPGVGVAFKLVQALQDKLDGLPRGQEKWLLDLVALGTVCDIVTLVDENRMHVYWGLQVLKKTRRPGLKALMAVAGVEQELVNARSLGFALGPRMNAAGRLETAKYAQDLLLTADEHQALQLAGKLDDMNVERRRDQDAIYKQAVEQAEKFVDDPVLVLSGADWNHGIVGIVAAKILEKFQKPTFILQELGEQAKGSARSYGDFSAADAIRSADSIITKGGGHRLAAGVSLPVANIAKFRARVNKFYQDSQLNLGEQRSGLSPKPDTSAKIAEVTLEFIEELSQLEPFGNGNPSVKIGFDNLTVSAMRAMGSDGQHLRVTARDDSGEIELIAFSAPEDYYVQPGEIIGAVITPEINEWRGVRRVQGKILNLWRCE